MKGGARSTKSLAEKRISGTARKDRHADVLEAHVKPVSDIPPPPVGFDKRHADKWNEVCRLIKEAGVLAEMDVDAVAMYVQNWFMAHDAWVEISLNGFVLDGKKNPACTVYNEAQKTVRQLGESFGFTPRSRQSLKVQNKPTARSAILEAMQGGLKKAQ